MLDALREWYPYVIGALLVLVVVGNVVRKQSRWF
jgi:hypothetical protein